MKPIKNLELKSSLLAIFGILLSKMCYILPLFGAVLGGGAFFTSINAIAPFMLLGSVLIFSYSWYKFMKPQSCNCSQKRIKKRNSLFLSSVFLAVLLFVQLILPLLQTNTSYPNASITDIPMCHTRN